MPSDESDRDRIRLLSRLAYYTSQGVLTYPRDLSIDEPGPAYAYMGDELIFGAEDTDRVTKRLANKYQGRGRSAVPPGLAVARLAQGLDPLEAAESLGTGKNRIAAPHMVNQLGSYWAWGNSTDPVPAGPPGGSPGGIKPGSATVAIVDTGMWDPIPEGLNIGIAEVDPIDELSPTGVVDWFGAGHGGFIAGVIAHRCSGAIIDVYRGFDRRVDLPTEAAVIAGVDRALAAGAQVVNLSVGTYGPQDHPPLGFLHAFRRWVKTNPEVLFVAAAGNDGLTDPWFPAAFADQFEDQVVSVGALQPDGAKAPWSNHGDWVKAWAQGGDVVSNYPLGVQFQYCDGGVASFPYGYARWSGTSFAAPAVVAEILRYAEKKGITPLAAWKDMRSAAGIPVTIG